MAWQQPSADLMEAMAQRALATLPREFLDQLGNVVFRVEEYADPDSLDAVGLSHPMQLSGLYTGRPLGDKSVADSGTLPDIIHLYRQPILAEAHQRNISVDRLVHHVLIHEIGHHFGLSDADMHALEDAED